MVTTSDLNNGGRVNFELGSEVRILELDGTIPSERYTVLQERSDRKGQALLKSASGREIKVHHRRVLPVSIDGKGFVLESGGKYASMCPKCGQVQSVEASADSASCSKCGPFQLHWLGVTPPMSEATAVTDQPVKAPKATKASAAAPKAAATKTDKAAAKAPKAPKAVKEVAAVDLASLAKTPSCELWTKGGVKFDHERIDLKAHVLICVENPARKLCFNTYNGALGKKANSLPIEAFLANKPVSGAKKTTPWFPVEDLEKQRAKLTKEGYEMKAGK